MTRTRKPRPEMLRQISHIVVCLCQLLHLLCLLVALGWWLHEWQAHTSGVFTAGNDLCAFPPPCVPNECSSSKAFLDTARLICAVEGKDAEMQLLCNLIQQFKNSFACT